MTAVESQTQGPLTYIVLFESSTPNVAVSYHKFFNDEDPEQLAANLSDAYKQQTNRFKRVLYRGVLLKRPAVSIVKLSGVANLPPVSGTVRRLLIKNRVYDSTLPSAIHKPLILRDDDRVTFCQDYKDLFAEDDGSVPQAAILIHQVNDPTASKVVGIARSVFSITLGLLGAFVF